MLINVLVSPKALVLYSKLEKDARQKCLAFFLLFVFNGCLLAVDHSGMLRGLFLSPRRDDECQTVIGGVDGSTT